MSVKPNPPLTSSVKQPRLNVNATAERAFILHDVIFPTKFTSVCLEIIWAGLCAFSLLTDAALSKNSGLRLPLNRRGSEWSWNKLGGGGTFWFKQRKECVNICSNHQLCSTTGAAQRWMAECWIGMLVWLVLFSPSIHRGQNVKGSWC